jgi:hypothetical protein
MQIAHNTQKDVGLLRITCANACIRSGDFALWFVRKTTSCSLGYCPFGTFFNRLAEFLF